VCVCEYVYAYVVCNRIEILDEIIDIAKRAVDRLSEKLEGYRGKGIPVEMSEEFRHTTLQVIGEAILSLSPEECDRVRACVRPSFRQHVTSHCV
jgi:hypothetical protein